MSSRLSSPSLTAGGIACFSLWLAAGPAFAIIPDRAALDYFLQREGGRYNAVVKQFSFETDLTVREQNDVLTGLSVTINQTFSGFSSATLVRGSDDDRAPQYLLTAAHTVLPFGWHQYEIGGQIYTAEQWWIPSGYDQEELLFAQDIAVVRLDRPVENVNPMTWISDPLKDLDGREFTMVGWGQGQGDVGGADYIGGIRRAGRNRFDGKPSGGFLSQQHNLLYDLDVHPSQLTEFRDGWNVKEDYPLTFESMILPGDSGGPALVGGEIAGVHSYIYQLEAGGNLHGASTDVRRFRTWIDALVTDQDAGNGPSAFGYEFGLAGITIGDIREDLNDPTPVLVPWLIAEGYLDPFTLQGTSPFFFSYDPATGLSPDDLAAATTSLTSEQWDAALSLAQNPEFTSQFRQEDVATQLGYLANLFVQDFGNTEHNNTIFYPWMFGENGLYNEYQEGEAWLAGDINRDGEVNELDLGILLSNWREETGDPLRGNLTMDDVLFGEDGELTAVVDEFDLGILLANWTGSVLTQPQLYQAFIDAGQTPPAGLIPEPTTLALLGLGGLTMGLRRRSRQDG